MNMCKLTYNLGAHPSGPRRAGAAGWARRSPRADVPRSVTPQSAFTLVEMLVVLAIIGAVAAMSVPLLMPLMRRKSVDQAVQQVKSSLAFARSRAIQTQQKVCVTILAEERAVVVTDYDVLRGYRTGPFCPHYMANYADEKDRFDQFKNAAVPNGSSTIQTLPEGCNFDFSHLDPASLANGLRPGVISGYDVAHSAWTWIFLPGGSVWTLPPSAANDESGWSKGTFTVATKPAGPVVLGPERKTGWQVVQIVVYAMTGQNVGEDYYIKP